MEGKFKTMDKLKKGDNSHRPKFNLICMGNVKDNKARAVLSEKAQPEQMWSTASLKNAPVDVKNRVNAIVEKQNKHKRMLMMSSKHFTFDCQHQIKRNHTTEIYTIIGS